jgi:hypothetical protein
MINPRTLCRGLIIGKAHQDGQNIPTSREFYGRGEEMCTLGTPTGTHTSPFFVRNVVGTLDARYSARIQHGASLGITVKDLPCQALSDR